MYKILITLLLIPVIGFSQKKDCKEDTYAINDKYQYINTHTWTDSGCVSKKTYKMKVNNKWVEISECLFCWYEKRMCISGNGNEYLCCGHIHLTKPGK